MNSSSADRDAWTLGEDESRQLETFAHQIQEATGVSCRIIDAVAADSHDLSQRSGCQFCQRAIALGLRARTECSHVHQYGCYQSERFGGQYIYFCPTSLAHWAVPIVVRERVVAYLVGGPVLLYDPDDFVSEEFPQSGPSSLGLADEVRDWVRKIPEMAPHRLTAIAELSRNGLLGVSRVLESRVPSRFRNPDQSSRIAEYIHELKLATEAQQTRAYPFEKERELLRLVARGDQKNSQIILNEILGSVFFLNGNDVKRVRARVQELVVLLSRAAVEGGASIEEVFGLNNRYLLELHRIQDVDDIADWLARILKRFSDCVFNLASVKHADVIQKAVQYIHRHYSVKIGLQVVADQVHMSPSHFSKVFKTGMGKSFVDYLTEVRIEQSRSLLLNRDFSLIDIAGLVGFEDQSYFSKVFRRHVGVSPGRYRETRGLGAPLT